MARASKGNGAHRADTAPPSGAASGPGGETPWTAQPGIDSGMRLAREAIAASLEQAQALLTFALALQQAQVRAWTTTASDLDQARTALTVAADPAALAAVPGRLWSAQWLHALESAGAMAEQLMQIETAWLQQAQAQATERMASLSAYGPAAVRHAESPSSAPAAGTEQAQPPWQPWFDSWQGSVEQMTHAWQDALRNARSPGH